MPRIRSLKPEFFVSAQIMDLSHPARLLMIGLILQADDEGFGSADPRKLKGCVFAGDDEITTAVIRDLLGEIDKGGLIVLRESAPHGLLYAIPQWLRHQKIESGRPSIYRASAFADLELAARPARKERGHNLETNRRTPPPEASPIIRRTIADTSPNDRHGSDLIGSDLKEHLRARAIPAGSRPVDNSEAVDNLAPVDNSAASQHGSGGPRDAALKLAATGLASSDIARALRARGVTPSQVDEWLEVRRA